MAVYGINWVKRLGGGVPEVVVYPEGASQTYKAGQILVFDTSLEGVKLASVGTTSMVGIALKDATGTTGADAPVLVPTAEDIFTATISASGANLAAAHDRDNIGFIYDWIASTETDNTDKITIDEDAAGGSDWLIVRDIYTDGNEPAGTAGGRMYFSFHTTALQSPKVA
jgi:hypothetical protein